MNKLKICITIDTEFSIAGTFKEPNRYRPVAEQAVFCNVNGVSEGLGFILKTFKETGIKGTFFVEALNQAYFGNAPMEKVVNKILTAGQDVQLHIHPVWNQVFSVAGWESKLEDIKPNDSVLTCSLDQLENLFGEGADILERWSGSRPQALRTGNLHVNVDVYRAMSNLGMTVSSNIGRGIYEPFDEQLKVSGGCSLIGDVYEYPVLSYKGLRGLGVSERKALTIIGSSFLEAKYLIDLAYEKQLGSVVVLTHPFEFIKGYDTQFSNASKNVMAQRRLVKLSEYVASNSDRFEAVPIIELDRGEVDLSTEREFQVPLLYSLSRIVANKINA